MLTACIVASPVTSPFASPCESGPPDDERPFPGKDLEKGLVGRIEDLVTEQAVHIILLDAVRMRGVRAYGVYGEISVDVVDDVWGLVDVPHTRRDAA